MQRVLSHHLPPELGAEQGRLVQAASAPQIWLPTPGGGGSYLQHQDTSLTAKTSASAPAPHSQGPSQPCHRKWGREHCQTLPSSFRKHSQVCQQWQRQLGPNKESFHSYLAEARPFPFALPAPTSPLLFSNCSNQRFLSRSQGAGEGQGIRSRPYPGR